MEELRDAWFKAPDAAAQKKLADEMQRHGCANRAVSSRPASSSLPTAYRSNISGLLIIAPIAFLWNVEKK